MTFECNPVPLATGAVVLASVQLELAASGVYSATIMMQMRQEVMEVVGSLRQVSGRVVGEALQSEVVFKDQSIEVVCFLSC